GAERLGDPATSSRKSSEEHQELLETLEKVQQKTSGIWKGASSEKAIDALTPLIESSKAATAGLHDSSGSMRNQAEALARTQGNLRPRYFDRDDYNALTDTVTLGSGDAEEMKAKWDDDNRHNIQQYANYKAATDSNRSVVKKDYEPISRDDDPVDSGDSGGSGGDSTGKQWVRDGAGPRPTGPGGVGTGRAGESGPDDSGTGGD